jgi:hypothetical protein
MTGSDNLFNEIGAGEHAQNWQNVISNGLAGDMRRSTLFIIVIFGILGDTVVNYIIRGI